MNLLNTCLLNDLRTLGNLMEQFSPVSWGEILRNHHGLRKQAKGLGHRL